VGYLGSILFRDDELVLCLFDAPVVRRAHDQEHLLVPHRVQLLEVRGDDLAVRVADERRPWVLGDQPPDDRGVGLRVKAVVAHVRMLAILGAAIGHPRP
jgi:hypothetical protein